MHFVAMIIDFCRVLTLTDSHQHMSVAWERKNCMRSASFQWAHDSVIEIRSAILEVSAFARLNIPEGRRSICATDQV